MRNIIQSEGKRLHLIRSSCLSDSDDINSSLSCVLYWLDLSVWWGFGSLMSSLRIPSTLEVLKPLDSFPDTTAFLTLRTCSPIKGFAQILFPKTPSNFNSVIHRCNGWYEKWYIWQNDHAQSIEKHSIPSDKIQRELMVDKEYHLNWYLGTSITGPSSSLFKLCFVNPIPARISCCYINCLVQFIHLPMRKADINTNKIDSELVELKSKSAELTSRSYLTCQ